MVVQAEVVRGVDRRPVPGPVALLDGEVLAARPKAVPVRAARPVLPLGLVDACDGTGPVPVAGLEGEVGAVARTGLALTTARAVTGPGAHRLAGDTLAAADTPPGRGGRLPDAVVDVGRPTRDRHDAAALAVRPDGPREVGPKEGHPTGACRGRGARPCRPCRGGVDAPEGVAGRRPGRTAPAVGRDGRPPVPPLAPLVAVGVACIVAPLGTVAVLVAPLRVPEVVAPPSSPRIGLGVDNTNTYWRKTKDALLSRF